DSRNRDASRISSGTEPKSWTASGRSAGEVSISLNAFGFFSRSERALTRSVVAKPNPPTSRTVSRKGRLVYPASGDRNKFDSNLRLPICTAIRMADSGAIDDLLHSLQPPDDSVVRNRERTVIWRSLPVARLCAGPERSNRLFGVRPPPEQPYRPQGSHLQPDWPCASPH